MKTIEAGPIELLYDSPAYFSKVSICLLSDNSVSLREYNRDNNEVHRTSTMSGDISAALDRMHH